MRLMTLLLTCPVTWLGVVGQIVHPVNAEGIDIKILSSDVNWEGVLNMDSEAKNHSIPLNLGTLRKCIVRIPANTNVHFIFCKAIDRAAFLIATLGSFYFCRKQPTLYCSHHASGVVGVCFHALPALFVHGVKR